MQPFCRVAFLDTAWRATLSAIAAMGLMYFFRADPPVALLIGAHVAIVFAVTMIVYALLLTDDRIEFSDPWLELEPGERPTGTAARHPVRVYFAGLMLRFAQGAAAIGAALAGIALLLRA